METFLAKGETEELVPLKHFLHRFTRSIFWELEDMIPFSNHVVYRCLWGWLGAPEVNTCSSSNADPHPHPHPNPSAHANPDPNANPNPNPNPKSPGPTPKPYPHQVSLLKLFQGPVIRKASCYAHVVQESIMPLHRLTEGIDKFDEWFGVYPLLVFPVRIYGPTPTPYPYPYPIPLPHTPTPTPYP